LDVIIHALSKPCFRDSRFDIFIIDVKGFTLTIPSLKEMAAFRLFKLILFASMNFKLEPNAVNKVEFVAFSVVESNCPNKSLLLFLSQASWQ
jgi:hypothetical protein